MVIALPVNRCYAFRWVNSVRSTGPLKVDKAQLWLLANFGTNQSPVR